MLADCGMSGLHKAGDTMRQITTEIKIGNLVYGFSETEENGVRGYDGRVDIRPPYQREFIYDLDKQRAVIDTIMTLSGSCLNLFQWADNGDDTYEVIDGQQRTLSICKYVNGEFSWNGKFFGNLQKDEQDKLLESKIIVNLISGTPSEKLEWFRRINVACEVLTEQEMRNATYVGAWLADAKIRFSKPNCAAENLAGDFVKGTPIRQELLELALKWISDGDIEGYMGKHQHDENADELFDHFSKVINWVKDTFDVRNSNSEKYRKEMRSVDWNGLYKRYGGNTYNAKVLEDKVKELMSNEEVTDKKGIYEYVLSGENPEVARKLSKRTFSQRDKRTIYERQGGYCAICGEYHDIGDMAADHIRPWWNGGITTIDNLQMVCKRCNGRKGGMTEINA